MKMLSNDAHIGNTVISGQLEIDHERGVIYFHDGEAGSSVLRICNLGSIQRPTSNTAFAHFGYMIDVTHMVGVSVTGLLE
jgi:hypothetical protein